MPHERLRPSFVFDEERLKQLQQIAPEAFADGNINWEVLKESLGEQLEDEGAEAEHFGLFWPGKREARKLASIPSKGALISAKGEGVDEDKTKNIFIEGENLEVLKLLQKSYAGKIKMIYIDPPYNTGNDFVYDDNFTEPLEEYLKYTGQMDEEGKLLTTNKRADGRFHSKWLSMMYPRIRLARNLLHDEGIIFVSIDQNELHNLRALMNEVFGEENNLGIISVVNNLKGRSDDEFIATANEFLLLYAKDREQYEMGGFPLTEDQIEEYDKEDKWGKYKEIGFRKTGKGWKREDRPLMFYPIFYNEEKSEFSLERRNKDDVEILPLTSTEEEGRWRWEKKTFLDRMNKDIVIRKVRSGKWTIFTKMRLNENGEERTLLPKSVWINPKYDTAKGGSLIKEIFGADVFDNPKPLEFIKDIVSISTDTNEQQIILDYFSGSSTTAHAILEINKENNGKLRFICIQFPEFTEEASVAYKKGYKTIAEIGKERIRKVIKTMKKELKIKDSPDLGFTVYKLDKSNFKQWQDYKGKDPKELTSLFKEHEIPLIDGWEPENLLIEVMLQEGFPLDSEIAKLKEHEKNVVIHIRSEFCEHKLLACFDKKIYQETINALNIQGEDIFVCLDSALSDEQKITLSDKNFLKTI